MYGTLAARDITKHHGSEAVLRSVSLTVKPGSRIGVVGPNGIGKSTLLRVLAGLEVPDGGSVTRAPAALEVGYLPQEADAREGETVLGYLARRTGVAAAEAHLDALAARLAREPDLAGDYADALDRFLALGGADLAARAGAICAELGLGASLDSSLASLSGGEAARARLAALLLARFDVFLLDEPTNDLDFDGLERLERFVSQLGAGLVVVSHDRAFLARMVTHVLELEAETRRPHHYAGGWEEYERARDVERKRHEADYAQFAGERARFTSLLRERRTQARAGGAAADRRGTHALMSKVRAAERRLERLERVEKPWTPWRLQLELTPARRSGEVVAELTGAVVERGAFRLGPLDLTLRAGERLAIVGRNGSGKSTLLGALLGTLPLAAGTRRVGAGVVPGSLDQRRELFDREEPLVNLFAREAGLAAEPARTQLAKFALGADDVARPARSLSPGERTRASLALLSALGVNLLVLDEPTNHLDLEAIEELERALDGYAGTVVLVTHDRLFLERFRTTETLELVA
jgi:ATPase subunit of ABC transporter with duplicated ATPase domains